MVRDIKKVLIKALFGKLEDAHDTANGSGINKVVIIGDPKREISILLMLIVVIDASKYIVDRYI